MGEVTVPKMLFIMFVKIILSIHHHLTALPLTYVGNFTLVISTNMLTQKFLISKF